MGEELIKIMSERDYKVVKANEIIQKVRFDLGLTEQKTFCYAVSKIKPGDRVENWYEVTINDYCDVCGIQRNDGRTIYRVKEAFQKLRNKSFWLKDENGDEVLIGWLDKVRVSPKSGKIKFRFDEDMGKYLFNLDEKFVQYSLLNVLPMRSAYSIRLYELLHSYSGLRHKDFAVDDLKSELMAPYVNFKDFRIKVLEVATREINLFTDIEITWSPINEGRKVVKVHFDIKKKTGMARIEAMYTSSDILDGQLTVDDLKL